MTRATTIKQKPSMRSPLGASPQAIELPDGTLDRTSRKAYELWQERGYRDGQDLEEFVKMREAIERLKTLDRQMEEKRRSIK